MDPLASQFVDVSELIFQHLSAKDVMKCSLVSSLWCEVIGSSHKCMKQIWLRLDKPSNQVELLKQSSRRYQNFCIHPGSKVKLAEILKNFRPRNVMISDGIHEKIEFRDYFKFMASMAPSIEKLQPGEGIVVDSNNSIQPLDFPNLKELQFTVTNRNAFSIFLGSNTRLEKVLLSFANEAKSEFSSSNNNIIHTFLLRNPQIKNLWVCEVDCTFLTDITENLELDLDTFVFAKSCAVSNEIQTRIGENLVKFIKTQRNLEWLKILCMHERSVFCSIWNEGKFKRLFIMDCGLKVCSHVDATVNDHQLQKNLSVIEINFYLNPSCHVLRFLRSTPNLKSFKLRQLSKQILEFAATNLPKLETIQFQSVEADVMQVYANLKASNNDGINRKIQLEEMDFFEFVGRDATF